MELESLTTTANTDKLRADELCEKLKRQSGRALASQTTVAETSNSLAAARELCRQLKLELLTTNTCCGSHVADLTASNAHVADLTASNAKIEGERVKLMIEITNMQVFMYKTLTSQKAKAEELRCERISSGSSKRWWERREAAGEVQIKLTGIGNGVGTMANWDWYDAELV